MIIFGVDFGDTRTGWAVCDRSELMASPAGVLTEKSFQLCAEKTAQAAKDAKAERIVVGYPKNMDGSCGARAEKCEAFAKLLDSFRASDPQCDEYTRQKAQGGCRCRCRDHYSGKLSCIPQK